MDKTPLAIAASCAAMFGAQAQAGDQRSVDACVDAVEQAADADIDRIRVRSISGGALKTVLLDIDIDRSRRTVACEVRRGRVTDLDWT